MKKPSPKQRKSVLDYSECARFIEAKHGVNLGDFANSFSQFDEWVKSSGEKKTTCAQGCSDAYMKAHQQQYARYKAAVAYGNVIERPYQDFWHWIVDHCYVQNGGTIALSKDDLESCDEDWQRTILQWFLDEWGKGKNRECEFLTEW
jgi:hypothetical protein